MCFMCMCLLYSGSAAANTLSQIYLCAFLFAYIWWKKLYVSTWGGEGSDICSLHACITLFILHLFQMT